MDNQDTQPSGGNSAAKWIVGIIVLAVVVWGVIAAQKNEKNKMPVNSGDQNQTTTVENYKIGIILPLTGDAASYGEPGQKVFQLAVDEINNNGGVGGKKLELDIQDGKCNGEGATNAIQKLINVDKVQIVIGGFCSSETLAAVPVAAQNKVAIFSIGSTSPKLTNISPFFFRIIPSDASQGSLDAQVAYSKGLRKVVFIQEQLDYPLGIYQAFSQKFQELGGTVTKEEFPPNATDFRTQLLKLKSQNPDALFIDAQASPADARILKQIKDLGWKPQLFINEAFAGDSKALSDNKDLLEGAIGAEFSVSLGNTKFQHLLDAYKQKYGEVLPYQSYGQTEYDSIYLLADGLKAVGYNGEKFAVWSRTVKDWEGASGKVIIKSDGDRESGYSSEIVKDGKMVPYTAQ